MFEPFTTVWIEFLTVDQARAYYDCTPYPCRMSPECDRSVDIMCQGRVVPTSALFALPGVNREKRPRMFVLDPCDPLPFVSYEIRQTSKIPAAA